jgi:hypothetical protein
MYWLIWFKMTLCKLLVTIATHHPFFDSISITMVTNQHKGHHRYSGKEKGKLSVKIVLESMHLTSLKYLGQKLAQDLAMLLTTIYKKTHHNLQQAEILLGMSDVCWGTYHCIDEF